MNNQAAPMPDTVIEVDSIRNQDLPVYSSPPPPYTAMSLEEHCTGQPIQQTAQTSPRKKPRSQNNSNENQQTPADALEGGCAILEICCCCCLIFSEI
ncbi:hypothetical protein BDF19DRAFT_453508 [Syncephalis fuscata]|nr:hypothetical protein BDF19DRAFT_453508 [Syncephalis fuscata]